MKNAKIDTIIDGDVLFADTGFDCLPAGRVTVARDENGLYVPCACGRHYLDGQADSAGDLIGLAR